MRAGCGGGVASLLRLHTTLKTLLRTPSLLSFIFLPHSFPLSRLLTSFVVSVFRFLSLLFPLVFHLLACLSSSLCLSFFNVLTSTLALVSYSLSPLPCLSTCLSSSLLRCTWPTRKVTLIMCLKLNWQVTNRWGGARKGRGGARHRHSTDEIPSLTLLRIPYFISSPGAWVAAGRRTRERKPRDVP